MIRKAVCSCCHKEMNIKKNNGLLIWLCPSCSYWIPTNVAGDGALLYRKMNFTPYSKNSQKYKKWQDDVYQIMKDKFWDKWENCGNNFKYCLPSAMNDFYCTECGKLYPNEDGKIGLEINPKWLKRTKI